MKPDDGGRWSQGNWRPIKFSAALPVTSKFMFGDMTLKSFDIYQVPVCYLS